MELFDTLKALEVPRCLVISDVSTGLEAFIVLDDLTLGPAAGGIRTKRYPSEAEALRDVAALARTMTLKCALAGVDAGGGKAVVLDHDGLDRPRAFEVLGARIEELQGMFRTAGDLGTTEADLAAVAKRTRYVHTDEGTLSGAVARGLVRCLEACAELRRGTDELRGLSVAVQGCGAIGSAVARALAARGVTLTVADLDSDRARALASELDARVSTVERILFERVDVISPCAIGGGLDEEAARRIEAWAVCGAANNILATEAVGEILSARNVMFVPDMVASAGAIIDGIGRTVMGLADRTPLIDRLRETAGNILTASRSTGKPTQEIARSMALERIHHRRQQS